MYCSEYWDYFRYTEIYNVNLLISFFWRNISVKKLYVKVVQPILIFAFKQKFGIFAAKNISMYIHSIPAFKECYIMQHADLQRFAAPQILLFNVCIREFFNSGMRDSIVWFLLISSDKIRYMYNKVMFKEGKEEMDFWKYCNQPIKKINIQKRANHSWK